MRNRKPLSENRRATLRDVAGLAGVSVQTVSNVTRGRFDLMGIDTRKRVEMAMEEVGYHPNVTARNLRQARTNSIGFFVLDEAVSFMADPLTALLVAGVSDVARDSNYEVLVRADLPFEVKDSLIRPLLERRADGAVAVLSGNPEVRRGYIELLKATDAPFVVFDEIIEEPDVLTVRTAERESSRLLTDHMIAKGHDRIAFIAARLPWALIEQRLLGYQDALAAAGLEPDPTLQLFEASWQAEGGRLMTEKLLTQRVKPTAIICGSDMLAVAAMSAVKRAGLKVPDDIAVAGFNDFEFSSYTDPPLTTVRVPGYAMGRTAASMLLGALDGEVPAQPHVVLENELIVRESA